MSPKCDKCNGEMQIIWFSHVPNKYSETKYRCVHCKAVKTERKDK